MTGILGFQAVTKVHMAAHFDAMVKRDAILIVLCLYGLKESYYQDFDLNPASYDIAL